MKLTTLVDELNRPGCRWLSQSQKGIDIFSFELFQPDTNLQPGVVYICSIESLPAAVPDDTSFFCVGHGSETPAPFANGNIVVFDGSLLTLLGEVGKYMTFEHRLQNDKQILIDLLNKNKGLQQLVDTAYKMLKNPVIVVDSAYKILAMNSEPIENRPDLEFQRQLGHMMDANIESLKHEKIYEKTRQKKYPYYSIEPTTHAGWINTLIYVYGIEAAQMGVMEHNHEFTHYDFELIHFISQVISIELQKGDFYKQNHALMHSTLLADLLKGQLTDKTAAARVHQLGWIASDYMYILTISDRDYGAFDRKAQIITEQLHMIYQNSRWVILDNKIVFLLVLNKEEDDELKSGTTLTEYLSANLLTAAISDRFTDLYLIKWKFDQCQAAYRLGTQLNPGCPLYFYKDYMIYHLGSVVMKELPAENLFHPSVIAMKKYDRDNGTDLVSTLKEYLHYVNDPGIAAQKLFIHKNTLFYRINKMKEQFGIDLNDGYERLRIQITILFMEL